MPEGSNESRSAAASHMGAKTSSSPSSLIHSSFNKYVLNTYDVPDTVLGKVRKTDMTSVPVQLSI